MTGAFSHGNKRYGLELFKSSSPVESFRSKGQDIVWEVIEVKENHVVVMDYCSFISALSIMLLNSVNLLFGTLS